MKNKFKVYMLSLCILTHRQINTEPGFWNLIYQLCTSTRLQNYEHKYQDKINSEGAVRTSVKTKNAYQFIFDKTIFKELPLDIKGCIQRSIDTNEDDAFTENDKAVLEVPAPGACPAETTKKLSQLPLPQVRKYLIMHQGNLNKLGSRQYLPGESRPFCETKESIMHYLANPNFCPSEKVFSECIRAGMSHNIKDLNGKAPWENAILKNDILTFKRLFANPTTAIVHHSLFQLTPLELVTLVQKHNGPHANEMYDILTKATAR